MFHIIGTSIGTIEVVLNIREMGIMPFPTISNVATAVQLPFQVGKKPTPIDGDFVGWFIFFEFYQKRICQAVPRWDSQDTMFCMLIMSRIGGNGFKGSKTYRHWLYNFHYDYVNWMKLGYTNLLVNERSSDVSPQSSGFNELLRTFTRVAPTGQEPITPW